MKQVGFEFGVDEGRNYCCESDDSNDERACVKWGEYETLIWMMK